MTWEDKATCYVAKENFKNSSDTSSKLYTFTGSNDQKQNVTAIYFEQSPTVDFIPNEIFENFPNLNSIAIYKSKIPIIKNNLFRNEKFENILELVLKEDKIKLIENNAFAKLKSLLTLDLTSNKIRSINKEIFAHNLDLEEIILNENSVKLIHPEAFRNQKHGILAVQMSNGKQCFDDGSANITKDLRPCYDNWNKAYEIVDEGECKIE
jgi:Leucine-rich repeat (LRR) protein